MDQLFLFMDSDQQEEVKEYYILEDGVYTHEKLKDEERDSLNTIFGKAMLAVTSLQQPETQEALAQQMQLPDGVDVMDAIAQLPDEARSQMMEQMTEKLEDMPESIVTQGSHPVSEKRVSGDGRKIWTGSRCSMCCGPASRCCFWQH